MGAGASVPDQVDEPTAKELAGDLFNQERFDKLASGPSRTIPRGDWIALAQDFGEATAEAKGEVTAHEHGVGPRSLAASSKLFTIGDVVKAKPEGEDLMVEGTILQIDSDGMVVVDFGDNVSLHAP